MAAFGRVKGVVTVDGQPAQREIIAVSYEKQQINNGGQITEERIVVGETISDHNGDYVVDNPTFLDPVIVIALEEYGEPWEANQALSIGDLIRPTSGNETGYVYEVTVAGDSGTVEPTWWVPAGGNGLGSIGTASAAARPSYWSLAHAPVYPEIFQAAADPFWQNVVLLLPIDSTDFPPIPDNGAGLTWQSAGGTQGAISTTRSVFDGFSLVNDDPNVNNAFAAQYALQTAVTLGTAWTIEFHTSLDSARSCLLNLYDANDNLVISIWHWDFTNGTFALQRFSSGTDSCAIDNTANHPSGVRDGNPHHIVFQSTGTTLEFYIDGDRVAQTLNVPSVQTTLKSVNVGQGFPGANRTLNGMFDNLRIEANRAKYGGNFTPPTAPYLRGL